MTNLNQDFEQQDGVPRIEFIEALIAMQKAIGAAKKTSKNPHFKTSYADLATIWDAVRSPIHDNGFVLAHTTQTIDGALCLRSALKHVSGGEISTHMPLMHRQGDMQSLMAAITYAKRGNLGCLTGVVTEDEDDDGNNTGQAQTGGATRDTSAPRPAPKPAPAPLPAAAPPADPVQAHGKNTDGSTRPHTMLAPTTAGDATKFVDRLIDYLGERPISKVRASEWVAANSEILEKLKAKAPVLFKRFEDAYAGIRNSSQAID